MVVTEPIPERLEEIGWRTHVGIADGRDLLYYLPRAYEDLTECRPIHGLQAGKTAQLSRGELVAGATHEHLRAYTHVASGPAVCPRPSTEATAAQLPAAGRELRVAGTAGRLEPTRSIAT